MGESDVFTWVELKIWGFTFNKFLEDARMGLYEETKFILKRQQYGKKQLKSYERLSYLKFKNHAKQGEQKQPGW